MGINSKTIKECLDSAIKETIRHYKEEICIFIVEKNAT